MRRALAGLILCACLALPALATAFSKTQVNGQPLCPAAAAAAGYTKLSFYSNFPSLANIDVNNTLAPGYQWYVSTPQSAWGAPVLPSSALSDSGGVLTINGTGTVYGGLQGLYSAGVTSEYPSPAYVGYAIPPGGFYMEATFSANQAQAFLPVCNTCSWVLIWLIDMNWILNNQSGVTYFMEKDNFEFFPTGTGAAYYSSDLHQWTMSGAPQNAFNWQTVAPLSVTIDTNNHKIGIEFIPSYNNIVTGTPTGVWKTFWDNVDQSTPDVNYFPGVASPPPAAANATSGGAAIQGAQGAPNNMAGLFDPSDTASWSMILSGGYVNGQVWPLNVSNVTVCVAP